MEHKNQNSPDYTRPNVPPATPPSIDENASPLDAAELANDNGDSDFEGSRKASLDRSKEDEEIAPGASPDEIVPDQGDLTNPSRPAEIEIERGDTDEPGEVPDETLLPPD